MVSMIVYRYERSRKKERNKRKPYAQAPVNATGRPPTALAPRTKQKKHTTGRRVDTHPRDDLLHLHLPLIAAFLIDKTDKLVEHAGPGAILVPPAHGLVLG